MSDAAPPRARPAARRDELLDAAAELFVEQGVVDTTVADVTARAGVAKGTFYLYFTTKAHLVAGLQERLADGMIAMMADILGRADEFDDYPAVVEDVVTRTVDYWCDHGDLVACLQSADWAEAADLVAAQDQRCVDLIEQGIRLGIERGDVDVADPTLSALMVFHGLHGATHQVLVDGGGSVDRDPLARACVEAVHRLLGIA